MILEKLTSGRHVFFGFGLVHQGTAFAANAAATSNFDDEIKGKQNDRKNQEGWNEPYM